MSFSYNASLPASKDRVRFLLQDNVESTARLQDEEISWAVSTEANVYMAAALCADTLATRYRGLQSKQVGNLNLTYSGKFWSDLATRLRQRGQANYAIPTAGGISQADDDAMWADDDAKRPTFFEDVLSDPHSKLTTARPVSEERRS